MQQVVRMASLHGLSHDDAWDVIHHMLKVEEYAMEYNGDRDRRMSAYDVEAELARAIDYQLARRGARKTVTDRVFSVIAALALLIFGVVMALVFTGGIARADNVYPGDTDSGGFTVAGDGGFFTTGCDNNVVYWDMTDVYQVHGELDTNGWMHDIDYITCSMTPDEIRAVVSGEQSRRIAVRS